MVGDPGLADQLDPAVAALRATGHEVSRIGPGSGLLERTRLLRLVSGSRSRMDYALYARIQNAASPPAGVANAAPPLLRRLWSLPGGRTLVSDDRAWRLARAAAARIPVDGAIRSQVAAESPDVVIITPAVTPGSPDLEYLRAARRLGIATVALLGAWSSLATEGTLALEPDALLVPNRDVAKEARRLHSLPPERVLVTGAPELDPLFDREPTRTREALCEALGLDAERPFALAAAGATGDPALGAALDQAGAQLARVEGSDRELWLDALLHCAAVVGDDAAAFVEAAVADRACIAVGGDEDTLLRRAPQLRHLLEARLVEVVPDADAAASAVAARARGADPNMASRRQFVRNFVRPHGRWRPAAEVMAEAIAATVRARARGVPPAGEVGPPPEAATKNEALRDAADLPERLQQERLVAMRRDHARDLAAPLALIWGDEDGLLASLLDGHPELHVRPPLAIGWPALEAGDLQAALAADLRTSPPNDAPLLLLPAAYEAVWEQRPASGTPREALDAHMTAFFNAWLDYQALHAGARRWIVAACDQLADASARAAYRAAYPDGLVLAVVNEDEAHARAVQEACREDAHGITVVSAAALRARSEEELNSVAQALGVSAAPSLLEATFNGMSLATLVPAEDR